MKISKVQQIVKSAPLNLFTLREKVSSALLMILKITFQMFFPENAFVSKLFSKLSSLFWLLWVLMVYKY